MKRTLSLLVALVMVISMVPNVFAANDSVDFDDLVYLENYSPLTVNIEAGATEPVEFLWIPEEEGTLTYDVNNADTTVSIVLSQGENTATSEAGLVKLDVVAGEEVSIKISDTTGAAVENLVINGTFGKECAHVAGEAVQENVVKATCTEAGSYDSVVYCTLCNEKLSSTAVVVDALGHTAGDVVVENKTDATCTEGGSYDNVTYCTVCGAETSRETVEVDALGHTPGEAVEENRVEATCDKAGSYDTVVYCTVCDAEISRETATIPANEHTAGEAVQENVVAATCTTEGSYDSVVKCSVCGAEISRNTITVDALGHSWNEGEYHEATTEANAYTLYTCNACGETKIEEVPGTQLPKFAIEQQPTDQHVILNQYATFTVKAVGAVSYQWQRLKSGATSFTNCSFSGYNTATLKVKASASNQTPFRCVITDAAGNQLITDVVTYTTYIPEPATKVTGQDGDKVVQINKEVSFSVTVENPDVIVSYHWQKRNPAGTYWLYTALPGYDTDTITMNATRNKQKYYRCEMTDINGAKIYSEEVTFTFAESPITLEILDYSKLAYAMSGTSVQLFVTVQGSNPTYEWQRSRDGGASWQTTSMGQGYNEANFSFTISRNNDFDSANNLYRCVVRDDYGGSVTSRGIKAIRLTNEFKIKTQPTDQVMEGGNPVQFTVAAQGTTLTYQWQYTKTIGGDFVNTSMTGYNTNTLTVSSKSHAGKSFRCMITDRDGTILYTDPVTYTVAE